MSPQGFPPVRWIGTRANAPDTGDDPPPSQSESSSSYAAGSFGLSTDLRNLLVLIIVVAIIALGVRLCSANGSSETPFQGTMSPATTGIPEDWHIWPHEPSPSEGSDSGFIWPTLVTRIDRALNSLKIDSKDFVGPGEAWKDERFTVYFKASAHLEPHKWGLLIEKEGHKVVATLSIADHIGATLLPSEYFGVVLVNSYEQQVSDKDKELIWVWDVTPKTETDDQGKPLLLNIDATIIINDRDEKHTVRQYSKVVIVHKRPDASDGWLEWTISKWRDFIRKIFHQQDEPSRLRGIATYGFG